MHWGTPMIRILGFPYLLPGCIYADLPRVHTYLVAGSAARSRTPLSISHLVCSQAPCLAAARGSPGLGWVTAMGMLLSHNYNMPRLPLSPTAGGPPGAALAFVMKYSLLAPEYTKGQKLSRVSRPKSTIDSLKQGNLKPTLAASPSRSLHQAKSVERERLDP